MKHIALYEYYSDLPKGFSVQEIEKMTEDQFLTTFKNYVDAGDEDQAFTLMQIWFNANPDSKNSWSFMDRFGRSAGKYGDLFLDKAKQKDSAESQLKRPKLMAEIAEVERSIKNYEEMLRMAKDRLASLRANIQVQFD